MSQHQNFTFSTDIWDIIISKLDGSSLRSLFSTCKYFYDIQKEIKENRLNFDLLNLKYNIVTVKEIEIVSSGGSDNNEIVATEYMDSLKLSIDNSFPIKRIMIHNGFKSSSRKCILSSFIFSKILYCNLTELAIEYNKISWNEYLLLTASETIIKISLEGVDITDLKSNQVPVHMLMSTLPCADDIHIQPCLFIPQTISNLLSLERKTRISTLNFVGIRGDFDCKTFYTFLKKNLLPRADIMIHFAYNEVNNEINENFIAELKNLSKGDKWTKSFHMDYPRNMNHFARTLNMNTIMSFIEPNSVRNGNR